jgi:uncharacterized OsmC-like protein
MDPLGGDMEEKQLTITLEQKEGYEFLVRFGEGTELLMDEPEPLGKNNGPSASKVLSAAIGNCLSASLLFCLQKARVAAGGVKTTVTTKLIRNENKRLRVGSSHVKISIDVDRDAPQRLDRCIELFEDFCVVTASVRKGINVAVEVVDQDGNAIYNSRSEQ